MQNIAILCALMTGATEAASSEVHPITSARLGVVANIWLTAGTASAGSPLVSTLLQASLCPSTPPAWLMAAVAPWEVAGYVGRGAGAGPLNGPTSATVRVEPAAADGVLPALLVPPVLLA